MKNKSCKIKPEFQYVFSCVIRGLGGEGGVSGWWGFWGGNRSGRWQLGGMNAAWRKVLGFGVVLLAGAGPAWAAPEAADAGGQEIPAKLREAIDRLKLPGVKINLERKSVDVEATVSLQAGLLELIACTKDTKEHESILRVDAKPSHVHAALLLLGAKPGNPAMRRMTEEDPPRFIDIPPRGQPIEVFLVFGEEPDKEHPISDFLIPSDEQGGAVGGTEEPAEAFPTHTFLFAGSILHTEGEGPRTYIADQTGSVISISTFGDELLCLEGFHDQANEALMWQANHEKLPEVGTKVILRMRPREPGRAPAPAPVPPAPEE